MENRLSMFELTIRNTKMVAHYLATAVILAMISVSAAALAQEAREPVSPATLSPFCRVFAFEDAKDKPKLLHAKCPGGGLVLGRATAFEAVSNEELKATLVDAYLGTSRRVLLLTVQDDGKGFAEDLTGQIARTAGRGPMSNIDGVELDFKQFALTGDIGVRGRPEDRGRAKGDKIGVAQQIALARNRSGAGSSSR